MAAASLLSSPSLHSATCVDPLTPLAPSMPSTLHAAVVVSAGSCSEADSVRPLLASSPPCRSSADVVARLHRRSTAPVAPSELTGASALLNTARASLAFAESTPSVATTPQSDSTASARPRSLRPASAAAVVPSPTAAPTLSPHPVPLDAVDELSLDAFSLHPTLAAPFTAAGAHSAAVVAPLPSLSLTSGDTAGGASARRKKTSRTLSDYSHCAPHAAVESQSPSPSTSTSTPSPADICPPLAGRSSGRHTLATLHAAAALTAQLAVTPHTAASFGVTQPSAQTHSSALRLSRRTLTLSALPALSERVEVAS